MLTLWALITLKRCQKYFEFFSPKKTIIYILKFKILLFHQWSYFIIYAYKVIKIDFFLIISKKNRIDNLSSNSLTSQSNKFIQCVKWEDWLWFKTVYYTLYIIAYQLAFDSLNGNDWKWYGIISIRDALKKVHTKWFEPHALRIDEE